MTHFLGDPQLDPARAGQKAANLHTLTNAGHDVPPGFVVYADDDLDHTPDERLRAAVARIGGFPVAVRSSGRLEDLEGASFAGQYETFLDVRDVVDLRAKIIACRASAHAERVQVYLKKQNLDPARAEVAVLVQRQVRARIAGVGFSIHPVTGREEHALVECCNGLGEKLVSGHVQPTRFVLSLRDGAISEREAGGEDVTLEPEQARALTAALLDLQALFHRPQDVEFAFDDTGALFLLQSRPITTIAWRTDVDEFTNADFKDGGISARICTPMMYSLYRDAMQQSMQRYFERIKLVGAKAKETWIASFYGRGYWNASAVKRAMSRIPAFSEEKFDQDLGIQKAYGDDGPSVVPTSVRTVVGVVPVAIAVEREYGAQLERAREFPTRYRLERARWLERVARFADTDDAAFFADLRGALLDLHPRTEQEYFTTIYGNTNAQSDFKGFIGKMDAVTGRETKVVCLIAGLSDVHHMNVQRGFVHLYRCAKRHGIESPAFERELALFIDENGFHGDAELDPTVPRWSEVPERVREHITNFLASGAPPADPDDATGAQRKQFEDEVQAVEVHLKSRLHWRARFLRRFRGHLTRVRAYLSAREGMREFSTQTYAIVRAYLVEAGQRLARRGDLTDEALVFMFHNTELVDVVEGRMSRDAAVELAAFRRKMYDGYRDLVPPNELGRGVRVRAEATFEGGTALRGLGCSHGRVEGRVRVVPTLDDAHTVRKGEILVTRFTDPGWTPVLGLVAGVVTEVGGLLSHAAVIGREYGIPAVLNLPGATKALKTGQLVRIDGTAGTVELLDRDEP